MSKYIAHLSEISLSKVLIKDETGDVLIDLAEETVAGKISMGTIDILESIGTTSVRGELIVDSTRGEFEALQLIGNESVQFVFESPPADENDDPFVVTSPEFRIFDFNDTSDFTDLSLTPEGFSSRSLTLKFSSKQEGDIFNVETPLPFGFLGKISSDPAAVEEVEGPPEPGAEEPEQIPGLINKIAEKYFPDDVFEIEATDNTAFLSPNRFTYPSRKPTKNMNLLQLMKYCTSYAWKSNNGGIVGPPAPGDVSETYSPFGWCNYFFWQDLYGWHFKSATKMAADSQVKGIKTFSFTSDMLNKSRIQKLDPISDFSINKAFSSGVLYAYHTRTEQNYTDVYSRFLGDDERYVKTNYKFNYATDYYGIVEPIKFLPDTLESKPLSEWIEDKSNNELEIKDYLFGWYDKRQFNNSVKLDQIVGIGRDKNAEGPLGNSGTDAVDIQTPESLNNLTDYNSYQDDVWQEMFDCVKVGDIGDLNADYDNLKKITKIKADTFNAKSRYKKAMNYKEKWNLYRYSVCCEVPEAEAAKTTTFAILKGHKKLAGTSNVFEYDWAEVCIIPKAAIGFIFGHKIDDYNGVNPWDNTLIGNAGLNSLLLIPPDDPSREPHNTAVEKYFPYVAENSVEGEIAVGELSGLINFFSSTPGVTAEGITGSISWDYVKDLFDDVGGVSAEGITLAFHNSQYSPFLVVEKPKGGTGLVAGSRAYNLNEIMNRPILDEDTYKDIIKGRSDKSGPSDRSTIFWQDTPVDSGDFDANPFEGADTSGDNLDNIQYMVGPGINASQGDNWTDYPHGFDTMPVGSYKTIARNDGGATGYIGGLNCEAIPIGHVVKLEFASFDDIYRLGIEGRHDDSESDIYPKGPKGIYYFSAQNAHDGKCEGSCTLEG